MVMNSTFRFLVIAISAFLAFSFVPTVHAEEDLVVVCVEQYPCDEKGRLLEQFQDEANPCYWYFLQQCNAAMEQRMESLEAALGKARKTIKTLRRENK